LSNLTSINLIAPINTVSYGIVSLNILKELSNLVDVCLWPIGQPQITNQEDHEYVLRAHENARSFDPNVPCIRIWHQFDLAQFVGKGLHIGFPIFELDSFNKQEKHNLKSVDHLFVSSRWAKEVINNDLGKEFGNKTSVIPLGVDSTIFQPSAPNNRKKYIFFNCGKWEVRKGHDILAEAFNAAFTTNDDVELWLMTENPFCSKEEDLKWKSRYIKTPLGQAGKIKMIPRVNTHKEVYNIMQQTDCGIFPSRAEGWNLEALEMMACNKPVIITDYSAHTQYCNKENSFLIPVNDVELAYDDKWFFGQGSWGVVDVKDVSKLMRLSYDSNCRDNTRGVETAKLYTWKQTAKEILNVLESI